MARQSGSDDDLSADHAGGLRAGLYEELNRWGLFSDLVNHRIIESLKTSGAGSDSISKRIYR
jgi:hypothetical protein